MSDSTARDFDFLLGHWQVSHRRLRERLAGCEEWVSFGGRCHVQPLLGGRGNVDDNVLELAGSAYRAVSLRSFDAGSRQWAIWWLDGRRPHALDAPVLGGFEAGAGTFYADHLFDGRPIRVRFRWDDTTTAAPRWAQAFSADGGVSWETNWTMTFTRAAGPG